MKRYDQRYIRKINQSRILELLYRTAESRAQIAKTLELTPSTVSEIVASLLEHEIIYEGEKVVGNIGKRPKLLYFNENAYFFLGLVITSAEINLVLCNLSGEIQREDSVSIPDNTTAREIIATAFRMTDRILQNMEREKLALISLGSPEAVNLETGKIRFAPYVQDWVGIDLASLYREKYGVEIILEDHVKLETLGEHWHSYSQVKNLVYIVISRGIGSGAIIDGKIRKGKHGFLGEIAYLPIGEKVELEELRRKEKGLGHFESQCDIKHIEETVREHLKTRSSDTCRLTFDKIAELYQTDPEVRNLIDHKFVETLSLGISAVIIMLDPEIVVLNGEITALGNNFLDLLKEKVFSIIPHRTRIEYSSLKTRAKLYGVIRNAKDHITQLFYTDPERFYRIDYDGR